MILTREDGHHNLLCPWRKHPLVIADIKTMGRESGSQQIIQEAWMHSKSWYTSIRVGIKINDPSKGPR